MGILQLPMQVPGMVDVLPNQKFMVTTDNITTITTPGYLNQVSLESNPISTTDILMVLYSFNNQTKIGTFGEFKVSIANNTITLTRTSQLYQTAVTLNTAQVIAAFATPQVLIPAVPGAVAIVHSANVYTASTGNTAFATGTAPIIQYGTTIHGAGTIATGAGLVTGDIEAATSQIRTLTQATSTTYTGITNTPVTFSCATAYTAGTGTSITFTLVYELLFATV